MSVGAVDLEEGPTTSETTASGTVMAEAAEELNCCSSSSHRGQHIASTSGVASYASPTLVQPKEPLQDAQVIATSEHVRTVWSPGNCLGRCSPLLYSKFYDTQSDPFRPQ
jgi:hypothetical protein